MRSNRLVALIALVAIGLVGCSAGEEPDPPPTPEGVDLSGLDADADNGIWRLEGSEALAQVEQAIVHAGPVHIQGEVIERIVPEEGADPIAGRHLLIDYVGDKGRFEVVIGVSGMEVHLILLNGIGYVRGNAAYANHVGLPELATGFGCVAGNDSIMADWSSLTDPRSLVQLLTSGASVAVSPPTGDGAEAAFVFGEGTPIGTMSVSAQGPPLPSSFVASDESGVGSLTFTDWGVVPDIDVPSVLLSNCMGVH